MKKFIFGAFSLAFAFSAQAVIVTWNCGAVYTPDLSGEEGINWTKTFLYADDNYEYYAWTANFTSEKITSGSAILTITEGTSGKEPFTYKIGDDGFNKSGNIAGATENAIPASANGLLATIVVTYEDWSMTTSGYFNTTASSGAANLTFSGPWTKTTMEPIPEPATMALLGIGVVAFGLRRRRE